jgi:hypothetical protein
MSHLKLFRPDGLDIEERGGEIDAPVILPFARLNYSSDCRLLDPLSRARTIHANRCCCNCGYPVVEPIELDDSIMNRNRLPIPGTATLVGFRCDRCHLEWPA